MKYESEGEGRASRITVTDNHPDAAVVEALREVLAVEKRLQDASWKHCEGETRNNEKIPAWSNSNYALPISFLFGL